MIGLYISLACISALAGYALSLKMFPRYPGMKNVDWSQPDGGFYRDHDIELDEIGWPRSKP